VKVGKKAKIALHDLTGFEGRCEAILFCKDANFKPVNEVDALTKFRRDVQGLSVEPQDIGHFDLIVAGGGLAGTCAAISAARQGIQVASFKIDRSWVATGVRKYVSGLKGIRIRHDFRILVIL